tara:strand:- start:11087 stop:11566 length:480 start_codon:yes stop_codon:yes gene_type:complete
MIAKKKVIYFTGRKTTQEELEFGKAIGAQFRASHIAAQSEPEQADYVAGLIPENYEDYPVYPEEAAEMIAGSSALVNGGTPEGTSEEPSQSSSDGSSDDENDQDDGEEIEISLEVLEKMEKDELLDMGERLEDFEFSASAQKSAPKMRTALARYFDIQE